MSAGPPICIARTRSGRKPGSTPSTCHQLRTRRPAPTSNMIARATSATRSDRRMVRAAVPSAAPRKLASPKGRRCPRQRSAGASPTAVPVSRDRTSDQPSTLASRRTSSSRASSTAPSERTRPRPTTANNVPSTPAPTASVALSVRCWRMIRAGLAPSAARRATSRARPRLRASQRLATLTAAISRTQVTAAISIHRARRDCDPTT